MITRPTSAQLIDEVRRELSSNVAPQVADPQTQGSLQMVDHILATLAVRAEHEIDLTGRVAVVTGAGRGIGAAYATALASHGAKVVVADIDAEAAASCAKRLSADGHTAIDVTVDISDRDSTRALASRVRVE